MKIYTKVEYEWRGDQLVVTAEEAHEYEGDVAECSGGGGGGTTYDWEAAERFAEVSRDQWEDYKRRFTPWEDKLISISNESVNADVPMAQKYSDSAFAAQQNAMELGNSRMGVHETPAQEAAKDRNFGLQKAAAMANATNTARQHADERQSAIMAGGMDALGKATGRSA